MPILTLFLMINALLSKKVVVLPLELPLIPLLLI